MNFFDRLMKGARNAIKPENAVMVIGVLALLGFYLNSDLPGATQLRRFLPFG